MNNLCVGSGPCECKRGGHELKRVVLTGGPGGGKTAILEIAKKNLCQHVAILPEAASIVFGGGFWRLESMPAKKSAQRAIFHVQDEMETLVRDEGVSALALCDRGTVDGLAYWPGEEQEYWAQLKTSRQAELSRYSMVVHLRTPAVHQGYNHQNPVRIESATEAASLDERIAKAWDGHPNRHFVESQENFLQKAAIAIELIQRELPQCCLRHQVKIG